MFRNRSLYNDSRWTEFHHCEKNGSNDIMKLLADRVRNIHLKTIDGKNCLHIAAFYEHLSLCKALIDQHNVDVNMAGNWGLTELHYFVENGKYQLLKFLQIR